MKKVVVLGLAVMALALSQGSAFAEDVKVGAVDFQKALNSVDQGRKAKAALKSEFDSKQKKLDIQQQELKKMQEDLEKQKGVLSQDAMVAKQKTFGDKYMDLQKSMAGYREELMAKEAKMTSQILQNLKTIVADVGKKENFHLIVETSQEAVLYAKTQTDLTDRVVSLYNQKFTGPLKTQ